MPDNEIVALSLPFTVEGVVKVGASATGVIPTAIVCAPEVAVLLPSLAVALTVKLKLFSNSEPEVGDKESVLNCPNCVPVIVQLPWPSDVPKLSAAFVGTPDIVILVTV